MNGWLCRVVPVLWWLLSACGSDPQAPVPPTSDALAYRGDSGVELTDAGGTVHQTLVADAAIFTWSPLAWSPDGRSLAVTRRQTDLGVLEVRLVTPDDIGNTQLQAFGDVCCTSVSAAAWSPDGRELLLEREFRSHTTSVGLMRFPVDESYSPQGIFGVQWDGFGGGVPRQQGLRGYMWPGWSPDGSQIVIHDLQQTYILSRDGTSKRLLAEGEQPDWSPDGSTIVYVTAGAGPGALHLIQPDGSNDRPLTTPPTDASDAGPAWSPDGSKVAFLRLGYGPDSTVTSVHAYVIGRDGSNERQLAALPIGSFLPTWSADGLHLAYSGDGTYVVNLDGSGFRLVSAHPTPPAQWRP